MQRCDKDRNGKLDFTEFHGMISRYKERKQMVLAKEEAELRLKRAEEIKAKEMDKVSSD